MFPENPEEVIETIKNAKDNAKSAYEIATKEALSYKVSYLHVLSNSTAKVSRTAFPSSAKYTCEYRNKTSGVKL